MTRIGANDAEAAETWIQKFSRLLVWPFNVRLRSALILGKDVVYEAGVVENLDVDGDLDIGEFLGEVRGSLLHHATAEWLEHSPRVMQWLEMHFRQPITPVPVSVLSSSYPAVVCESEALMELMRMPRGMKVKEYTLLQNRLFAAKLASPVFPLSFSLSTFPSLLFADATQGISEDEGSHPMVYVEVCPWILWVRA
jgi:hypothetical protein